MLFAVGANLVCERLAAAMLHAWQWYKERKCGRIVCAWCKPMRDLGPAWGLPKGKDTHGICPTCYRVLTGSEFVAPLTAGARNEDRGAPAGVGGATF